MDETPFHNVRFGGRESFSLPTRKWREVLFVGAMVRRGELYVRDPTRPLPPFRDPNLFPEGVYFRVEVDADGDWVTLRRV